MKEKISIFLSFFFIKPFYSPFVIFFSRLTTMSNYGLNTPSSRDNNRLFEPESPERHSTMQQTPYLTFTPCTRLSRMTIDSQSNGVSGRTRPNVYQLPVTNFNEKLMQVVKEEESSHPNLTMFLGSDKISIFDKKKVCFNNL
jgi:hypothetical protein